MRKKLLRKGRILKQELETPSQASFAKFPFLIFQVTNLPHPYKTDCGMPKLRFFDTYSKSKCFLDKLTRYVTKLCKCRDWFMPGKVAMTGRYCEQMIRALDARSSPGRSH